MQIRASLTDEASGWGANLPPSRCPNLFQGRVSRPSGRLRIGPIKITQPVMLDLASGNEASRVLLFDYYLY